MSEWKQKRFSNAAAHEVDGGWSVGLDGRMIKTPAKSAGYTSLGLAGRLLRNGTHRRETQDQCLLRTGANSAIDKVVPQNTPSSTCSQTTAIPFAVLPCRRPSDNPGGRPKTWDPLLEWAREVYGAPLLLAEGLAWRNACLRRRCATFGAGYGIRSGCITRSDSAVRFACHWTESHGCRRPESLWQAVGSMRPMDRSMKTTMRKLPLRQARSGQAFYDARRFSFGPKLSAVRNPG